MEQILALASLAADLTAALSSEARHQRLLSVLHRVIPYDAAALLRLDGDALIPVATEGLSADTLGRRFLLSEHPRLSQICESARPIHFPSDCDLPDPYDGLIADSEAEFSTVHACMGCALRVHGELVGALTADAAGDHRFDAIDLDFLAAVGDLAAAALHSSQLLGALKESAERQGRIAQDLMRDVALRQGSELVGRSPALQQLRSEIDVVARSEFTVLITGETGAGKELVARAVHQQSTRRETPMLYVNCAALPEMLAESELFGHLRGAFTGADTDRAGKFEVASGGTLFLDEIGELPLSVQAKLLRAIQQGEIQRVGSDALLKTDVRLVAATNRDLEQAVAEGRFRADLFHRLNVFPIHVPPLRDRRSDIPQLTGYFCDLMRRRLGLGPVRVLPDTMSALKRHSWPGNVRELENTVARACLKAATGIARGQPVLIRAHHLGRDFLVPEAELVSAEEVAPAGSDSQLSLREATMQFQRERIMAALKRADGNWAAAARELGLHRSNLHHLAVRLGLKESKRQATQ